MSAATVPSVNRSGCRPPWAMSLRHKDFSFAAAWFEETFESILMGIVCINIYVLIFRTGGCSSHSTWDGCLIEPRGDQPQHGLSKHPNQCGLNVCPLVLDVETSLKEEGGTRSDWASWSQEFGDGMRCYPMAHVNIPSLTFAPDLPSEFLSNSIVIDENGRGHHRRTTRMAQEQLCVSSIYTTLGK